MFSRPFKQSKNLAILIENIRREVIKSASDSSFIHHGWYIKYHIELVERISLELCDIYPEADAGIVLLLVWLHDYGKIIDREKPREALQHYGKKILLEAGSTEQLACEVIREIEVIDGKEDLEHASIEIKIVSSADGASHLLGPFFALWWYENADKHFEELMNDNLRKATQDWKLKIVLPEVKKAFKTRYEVILEQYGKLPGKFLSS